MEPSTDKRNQIIAVIIICVIVICALAYFFSRASSPGSTGISTATSTPISTATSTSTMATSSPGYTVTITPTSSGAVAPNYAAPLTFSGNQNSPDEITALQSQYAQVEATLKASPKDFDSWIQLGVVRKEAGDYQGAAADWQYMSELYPTNVISNADLADLYTNFLPNYPLAVAAYKAQIKNDPTDVYIYVDLYQLYTNQYPQSTATIVALLKQGLTANPGNDQLQSLLAKYQ